MVDVLDHQLAAGLQAGGHARQHGGRVRHVGEQEPRIDHVVAVALQGAHVTLLEGEVGDPGGLLGGQLQHLGVAVDAQHPPLRPGHAGELPGDVPSAATHVQAAVSGSDAHPLQQREGGRAQDPGNEVHAAFAVLAAAQRIRVRALVCVTCIHSGHVPAPVAVSWSAAHVRPSALCAIDVIVRIDAFSLASSRLRGSTGNPVDGTARMLSGSASRT